MPKLQNSIVFGIFLYIHTKYKKIFIKRQNVIKFVYLQNFEHNYADIAAYLVVYDYSQGAFLILISMLIRGFFLIVTFSKEFLVICTSRIDFNSLCCIYLPI